MEWAQYNTGLNSKRAIVFNLSKLWGSLQVCPPVSLQEGVFSVSFGYIQPNYFVVKESCFLANQSWYLKKIVPTIAINNIAPDTIIVFISSYDYLNSYSLYFFINPVKAES